MKPFRTIWDDLLESTELPLAVASAFFGAWVVLTFATPLLFGGSVFAGADSAALWMAGAVSMSIIVFIYLRSMPRWLGRVGGNAIIGTVALMELLGSLLMLFSRYETDHALVLVIVAGILMGIALPFSLVAIGVPYAHMSLRRREMTTAVSGYLVLVLVVVDVLLPVPAAQIVLAIMPLAAFGIAANMGPRIELAPHEMSERSGAEERGRAITGPFAFSIVIYGFVATFVMGVGSGIEGVVDWLLFIWTNVFYLAASLSKTIYMFRSEHADDSNVSYRPNTLMMLVGLLLLPFLGTACSSVCAGLCLGGIVGFVVYFWIVVGNHIQKYEVAEPWLISKAFMLFFLGAFIGLGVPRLLAMTGAVASLELWQIAVVGLFAVAFLLWQVSRGDQFADEPDATTPRVLHADQVDVESEEAAEKAHTMTGDDFAMAVQSFARRYALSDREAQVVGLILHGRSVPYICDELFIAKSTVQTHVKHAYAKCGVTSRQELIDLFEVGEG